jgi:DNA-binding NarL/FixJ family response regulator
MNLDAAASAGYRVEMAIDVASLPAAAEKLGELTPSEQAVLPLVLEGLGSQQIAQRLGVSESLVC